MTTPRVRSAASGTAPTAMHIGEVAARTELSVRSLRHWDEVGLLRPSGRSEGGFRLYTEADVEKILLIRRMKPLGFTLEQMAAALRDLETLRAPGSSGDAGDAGEAADAAAAARARLVGVLEDAAERRARLERGSVRPLLLSRAETDPTSSSTCSVAGSRLPREVRTSGSPGTDGGPTTESRESARGH